MDPNSLGDLNVMVDVAVERVLLLHSLPELMLQLHQARCEVAALQEVQDIDTREIRRLLAIIGESHYAGAAAVTAPSHHATLAILPQPLSKARVQNSSASRIMAPPSHSSSRQPIQTHKLLLLSLPHRRSHSRCSSWSKLPPG